VIATPYRLPFSFAAPADNPWDGRRPVELVVQGIAPIEDGQLPALRERLAPFWVLADAGGLAGNAAPPWQARCREPVIGLQQGVAQLRFEPTWLDERATQCLVCLLLALHAEVPLVRATLSVAGSPRQPVLVDPKLDEPYPGLWSQLPFAHQIEDAEGETRVLVAQFHRPLADEQLEPLHRELMRWGTAAAEGAFGIAPVEPSRCGCLPINPLEHYEGEVSWPVERCRFHPAALEALVGVCAAIHHRVAPLAEVIVE
jgi:hypothetical protein